MLDRVLVFLLLVGGVRGQCPVGMYGDNCKLKCSPYCAPYEGQKVHCDKQSGRCSEGCFARKYGDQCHLTCSRNCRNRVCGVQTGHCVQGCVGNNTGHFCEISREPGAKQSERASKDSSSPALVPILVPVLVITIIFIVVAAVIVLWRKYHPRSNALDQTDVYEDTYTGNVTEEDVAIQLPDLFYGAPSTGNVTEEDVTIHHQGQSHGDMRSDECRQYSLCEVSLD